MYPAHTWECSGSEENIMATPSIPYCAPTRITESSAVSATKGRIFAIQLVAAAANSKVALTDDADGSGTPLIEIEALAAYSKFDNYCCVGGIDFSTACYATVTGAGAVAYIWYA